MDKKEFNNDYVDNFYNLISFIVLIILLFTCYLFFARLFRGRKDLLFLIFQAPKNL